MHIRVRLFAMQRAQAGKREHELQLPEGADVAGAWDALVAELPVLASGATSVRFARNGVYVSRDAPLSDGDELAVIPPVAGGSPDDAADDEAADVERADVEPFAGADGRFRRIELSEAPLEDALLGQLRREVAGPADGAVTIFVGQTRTSPGTPAPGQEAEAARFTGQLVEGLAYEAFEPMALATLEAIADEMEERFGIARLAIIHRVGEVGVGEASVVIAVAAAHREEAFAGCRYAIEELKARAPIWKAERFADGSVWMGAPAREGPAGARSPTGERRED